MENKVNEAVGYFNEGFNCAQAVVSAYCEQFGLDKDTALKLACGFGGGMGRLGEVCGAVSGAYILFGLKYGDDKEKTYSLIQEFEKKFKERNKTTICRELLNVDLRTGEKKYAGKRVKEICHVMVKDAAEIVEELL